MKKVPLYEKVRRAVAIDGMKKRAAARYFGINRGTVDKMMEFPAPPEHGRRGRTYSRKLTGFTAIIDQIWPMTAKCTASSATRRSGYLSACGMNMALPVVARLYGIMLQARGCGAKRFSYH
jgi:hypothetical protein